MTVQLDHLLVFARDKYRAAQFFAGIFGLSEPQEAGFFVAVHLSDGVVLNFAEPGIDFPGQHYAFLVGDDDFEAILERIQANKLAYWADPQRRLPSQINTNHGGRGIYFIDPDGHYLEALTRRESSI
jgi:catechol 2,3-dioxygenase-like lactoylglutathione lyase family enzyme